MTDFSQSNEQAMILEWADRRPSKGRWLDVGAADGVSASNTRALALRGWPGVAVEPAAILFDRLAHLYADRDDVEVVNAVLAPGVWYGSEHVPENLTRLARFHYSPDLVSTTEDENADTWRELASFVTVRSAVVTVDELLEELPGPYDFLSVDTEGTSLVIARSLLDHDALAVGGLLCVECEDGQERWEAQTWCLDGYARLGVTPNNLLLERLV